jgi:hypothetical protein
MKNTKQRRRGTPTKAERYCERIRKGKMRKAHQNLNRCVVCLLRMYVRIYLNRCLYTLCK